MATEKRKGRPKALIKISGLFIACLSFLFILSCSSGTSSTTSSSGSSGTGTGWTIAIQIGTNPISSASIPANTTTVLAIVKDKAGAPAPLGTNVCMTAVRNGFLKPGGTGGQTTIQATICETTTNNIGQSIQTYQAALPGIDTIEVSSQGVIAHATITVN